MGNRLRLMKLLPWVDDAEVKGPSEYSRPSELIMSGNRHCPWLLSCFLLAKLQVTMFLGASAYHGIRSSIDCIRVDRHE